MAAGALQSSSDRATVVDSREPGRDDDAGEPSGGEDDDDLAYLDELEDSEIVLGGMSGAPGAFPEPSINAEWRWVI